MQEKEGERECVSKRLNVCESVSLNKREREREGGRGRERERCLAVFTSALRCFLAFCKFHLIALSWVNQRKIRKKMTRKGFQQRYNNFFILYKYNEFRNVLHNLKYL